MRRAVGGTNVIEVPRRMGAEDFSYYQKLVPGFYYRLGSGNPAKGITAEAHKLELALRSESVGAKTNPQNVCSDRYDDRRADDCAG